MAMKEPILEAILLLACETLEPHDLEELSFRMRNIARQSTRNQGSGGGFGRDGAGGRGGRGGRGGFGDNWNGALDFPSRGGVRDNFWDRRGGHDGQRGDRGWRHGRFGSPRNDDDRRGGGRSEFRGGYDGHRTGHGGRGGRNDFGKESDRKGELHDDAPPVQQDAKAPTEKGNRGMSHRRNRRRPNKE